MIQEFYHNNLDTLPIGNDLFQLVFDPLLRVNEDVIDLTSSELSRGQTSLHIKLVSVNGDRCPFEFNLSDEAYDLYLGRNYAPIFEYERLAKGKNKVFLRKMLQGMISHSVHEEIEQTKYGFSKTRIKIPESDSPLLQKGLHVTIGIKLPWETKNRLDTVYKPWESN